MAVAKKKLPNRSNSKESYRIWFQFLKRAIAEDKKKVKLNLYKAWGDVTAYKFNAWWDEIGSKVINLNSSTAIEFATDHADDPSSYLVRVPKSLTSTAAATQLRLLLTNSNHKPVIDKKSLRVTENAEIRHPVYRAYLHVYDIHKELAAQANGKKVTNKETLIAVRKFYVARFEKYKNRNWRADNLPRPLWTAMNMDNLEDVDVLASADAIAAIGRYLKKANEIIGAVNDGRFPY